MLLKAVLKGSVRPHQIAVRFNSTSVYLVDGTRTPIGSFKGQLQHLQATQLGAIAVRSLLERTKVPEDRVDCV